MSIKRPPTIVKFSRTCDDCGNLLTDAEKAFHGNVCGKCNHARNTKALEKLAPFLKNLN